MSRSFSPAARPPSGLAIASRTSSAASALSPGTLPVFGLWIASNLLPRVPHFDPHPFSLLGTIVGLEAIILASFIVMRQARLSRRSDERGHLMLQILLLTEKEVTAILAMDRKIAGQVGLEQAANAADIRELSQHTSIEDVAQTIKENISVDPSAPTLEVKDNTDPFGELF